MLQPRTTTLVGSISVVLGYNFLNSLWDYIIILLKYYEMP